MLGLLFFACGASLDPEDWHDVSDCEAIDDTRWADECYAQLAVDVMRGSDEAGEALIAAITDPLVKDYVLLKVTREVHPGTPKYCRQIEKKELRSRCDLIVRRPHLHRELLGLPDEGMAQPGPPGPGQGNAPPAEVPAEVPVEEGAGEAP